MVLLRIVLDRDRRRRARIVISDCARPNYSDVDRTGQPWGSLVNSSFADGGSRHFQGRIESVLPFRAPRQSRARPTSGCRNASSRG